MSYFGKLNEKNMKVKNVFLITLTCLLCLMAQAQTEKGHWLVGATTSDLTLGITRDFTQMTFQLSPSVGYFVADNLAVGARLGLAHSFANSPGLYRSSNSAFAISGFGRYYIPLTERLKIPIDLSVGYQYGRSNQNGSLSDGGSLLGTATTGLSCFLNDKVSIDLMAGYRAIQYSSYNSNRYIGSLTGQIGFSIYLAGKGQGD
jgi:hypothetical protein